MVIRSITISILIVIFIGVLHGSAIAQPTNQNLMSMGKQVSLNSSGKPLHPLLGDIRIRRALAYCTNRPALLESFYGFLTNAQREMLLMDSFLPKNHWAYAAPPLEYTYPFSPTVGQALLEQAGWTLQPGATYRTNAAGYQLALKLNTTNSVARRIWVAALETQLRNHCGIRLVRFHLLPSQMFNGEGSIQYRKFELSVFAWGGSLVDFANNLYACDQIPNPSNNWSGSNIMGWCNPTVHTALRKTLVTVDRAEFTTEYANIQSEFVQDMVSLPLFSRLDLYATRPDLVGFEPIVGENLYTWNVYSWTVPARDTIVIGTHYEPESLTIAFDPSFTTSLGANLIYGSGTTNLNYASQAWLYQSIPSMENGGVTTKAVSVSEGMRVFDAFGSLTSLQIGTPLLDSTGQMFTYTGGIVTMPQISITSAFLPNLKWSDGSLLTQADLELWETTNCNPNNNFAYTTRCSWLAQYEILDATTVRYTLLPGYLPISVFEDYLPGAYPAERVLSDGRKLKEVPTEEWANLQEITRSPIGLGPYRIVEWQRGHSMTFERNPYFALGLPQTPTIIIRFVGDPQTELLAGEVDVVGPESNLDGFRLANAAAQNQIKLYPIASSIWEHLDMNLELYTQIVVKDFSAVGGVITSSTGFQAEFPVGALTAPTTTVTFNQLFTPSELIGTDTPVYRFTLSAKTNAGGAFGQSTQPYSITLQYTDDELIAKNINESTLNLVFWNGSGWEYLLPCAGCSIDLIDNKITVVLNTFSEFMLVGTLPHKIFLPILSRAEDDVPVEQINPIINNLYLLNRED